MSDYLRYSVQLPAGKLECRREVIPGFEPGGKLCPEGTPDMIGWALYFLDGEPIAEEEAHEMLREADP